jgi:quinol monooxygenase YgiN
VIIGRFKVTCRPERVDEVTAAMAAVEAPSRRLPGVVRFDVVRSLTDPNALLAVEVFEDRDALDRQNAQDEVAALLRLIGAGAIVGDYEWTVWESGT